MSKELSVLNTMAILEELDASKYGNILIKDALTIAERLLQGEEVNIYMRWKEWRDSENEEMPDTYVEGWRVIDYGNGRFSHMVGSPIDAEYEHNRKFMTMSATRGFPKENHKIPMAYWTSLFTFRSMFAARNLEVVNGTITIKNKEAFMSEFQHWEKYISASLGRPMEHVLRGYSLQQLEDLENDITNHRLRPLIETAEQAMEQGIVPQNILTFNIGKTITVSRAKLDARLRFWKDVLERDLDYKSYAKLYSPNSPEWEEIYRKFNPNMD